MLNLNSIMIGTDNLEALVEFYTKVLGKPMMEMGGYVGWLVGNGFINIGTHSDIKGKNTDPARCIWFFETADVKGEFERIKGLGAEVIKEPYEPQAGFWLATFADVDGNYFQLASPWDQTDEHEAKS